MKLLIVEDDALLQSGLAQALSSQVRRGLCWQAESDALLHSSQYSLIVLDPGLPDRDGATLLRQWHRGAGTAPYRTRCAGGSR